MRAIVAATALIGLTLGLNRTRRNPIGRKTDRERH